MYYFIFYFIYRAKIKQDGETLTRYSAAMVVVIAIYLHLNFLYSFLHFLLIYGAQTFVQKSPIYNLAKGSTLGYIIIGAILFFCSYKYFNKKKINMILRKFNNTENFYTGKNILKFVLLFLVPLFFSIVIDKLNV